MIKTYNLGTINFEWWEWILILFLIAGAYFIGARVKIKNIHKSPEYQYLVPALMFKIFAGIFFGLIYVFYYGGGDTISYYSSTVPLSRLFFANPNDYFDLLWNSSAISEISSKSDWTLYIGNYFTNETGSPMNFIVNDSKTFAVCKLTSPILILTNGSYFGTTIIISSLSFIPIWRLYKSVLTNFPVLHKELAISFLFVPSVLFWGSGIMKDTYTFAATCLIVSSIQYIIRKENIGLNIIIILISAYSILSIKPYILNILIPSIGIWIYAIVIQKVENIIFKTLILPVVLLMALAGSYFVLSSLSSNMDKFALDKAVETANITSNDLKRSEQYGDNSFDIGTIDGSPIGMISLFPQATFAGLFRPMIIESRSVVMLLSGVENLLLLILLILTFWRTKFRLVIKLIRTTPILLFFFVFSILFAFMLGITTPNFGALVRFKIPLLPFFSSGLIIIYSTNKIVQYSIDGKNE